jgi:ribonuclease P protein component
MPSNKSNILPRNSMLKLSLEIDSLFKTGKKIYNDCIKVIWTVVPNCEIGDVKLFISVPKRNLNKATTRNLAKRRIKEAYRINNNILKHYCSEKNIKLNIGIIYIKDYVEEYNILEQKIVLSLQKILQELYEIAD